MTDVNLGNDESNEQRHRLAMVLPERKPGNCLNSDANLIADGWNTCLDEIAKLGPLYTHADAGEVRSSSARAFDYDRGFAAGEAERDTLRAQVIEANCEIEKLRAQLAERSATKVWRYRFDEAKGSMVSADDGDWAYVGPILGL